VSTQEPESVARLQELLDRLEKARAQLEATEDPEQAVDVLQSLAELLRERQALQLSVDELPELVGRGHAGPSRRASSISA